MTILPVKKKRDKDSSQKTSSGNVIDGNRTSSSQASASKRPRPHEDGPYRKRWAMSPSGRPLLSPLASPHHSSGPSCSEPKQLSPSAVDYNSDDEYQLQNARDDSVEAEFAERLAARGLIIKEMVGDGACMFRAIAEQVYGDQEMHGQIRQLCMDYMANNRDHFQQFITENYENYIRRKREEHVHGNHVELQAISEMFARPVEVYQYSDEPINVLLPRPDPALADGAAPVNQNAPLRLSYHRAVHYNAIIAPNVPTIGVGLGLPGMVPGSADKEVLSKAMAKSELEHIEEAMLQDKIGMTDFQRTQADLEEQIARESLLSYFRDLEKVKNPTTSGEGPSTSSATLSTPPRRSKSPGLYEELLAAQTLDWETYAEEGAIAEALLLSQQDYLMQNKPGPSGSGNSRRPSE